MAEKEEAMAAEEAAEQVQDGAAVETEAIDAASVLEQKDAALEEMNKKYQRLQADFENFRRRTTKEKEDLSTLVAEGIITELLPVVDNFERALATEGAKEAGSFYSGVEMISRQLGNAFEKLGVTAIEAVDKAFDPNEHQAVMRVEDDSKEDGMIVEELQKGYRLKNRVLRPSMVKVVNNG